MAILTVYATSCVSSYDINVAIMDDKDRLIKICEVLNKFSGSLPDLDVYSKLGDFLCNPNWVEVLKNSLIYDAEMNEYSASRLIDKIKIICDSHYIFTYSDIFSVEDIIRLT